MKFLPDPISLGTQALTRPYASLIWKQPICVRCINYWFAFTFLYNLPLCRRGLSRYFSGKSQSFSCMSRAASIADLAKPENPFNMKAKRRKTGGSRKNSGNIMSCKNSQDDDNDDADDEEEENHHHHHHHSYPPRKPGTKLHVKFHQPDYQMNHSQLLHNNKMIKSLSSKCVSVPELQETWFLGQITFFWTLILGYTTLMLLSADPANIIFAVPLS